MIRFLALIGTAWFTALLVAVIFVANHGQIPLLAQLIRRLLPLDAGFAAGNALAFWTLQLTCYAALRWYLTVKLDAHRQQTPASPQRQTWWMGPAATHLMNSAPGWPRPFGLLLLLAAAFTAPLALSGSLPAPAWGLAALFALVLLREARDPEPPEPLWQSEELAPPVAAGGAAAAEPATGSGSLS